MKPVHAFWTPGDRRLSSLQMSWPDLRYHLLSWVLSACTIRRFYNRLELITDDYGEEILVGQLGLPYTCVRKDYEGLDLGYPASIWAAKKMYGYTLHEEPFLNIDGDVSLWAPLPEQLLQAPLIAQNVEINVPFYLSALREIKTLFPYQPDFVRRANPVLQPVLASNAGILGGSNLDFIKEYVRFGFDFLNRNLRKLEKVDKGNQNIVIEQFFFYELARRRDIPIAHLIDEPTTSRQFPHMTHFTALPGRCRYIHIMGGKKYASTCEQLEQRTRIEFPEQYFRVLDLIRKNKAQTGAFFFNAAEENAALQASIPETVERYKSLLCPDWEINYSRTLEILAALKLKKRLTTGVNSGELFVNKLNVFLQSGGLAGRRAVKVLQEIFAFETDRCAYLARLPPLQQIEAWKRANAEATDRILRLPPEQRNGRPVQLSPIAFVWDGEWNWAEKKEFKAQVENKAPYSINLKREPLFYRLVLFLYPQQGIAREYLADPLTVFLLDVLEEHKRTCFGNLLDAAFEAALKINPQIGGDHRLALLDQLTFLAYQGVISFTDSSD